MVSVLSLGEKMIGALRQPDRIRDFSHRAAIRFNSRFSDAFVNDDPVRVMEEDWDNLLILDACRYDTFSEENWLDGSLERRVSIGSSTGEFLCKHFHDRTHFDTVYVTANPHLQIVPDTFHRVVDLVNDDEYWDPDLRTVPPDSVAAVAQEIHHEYPNKRLIVHFIQPHYPFIGPTGRDLEIESAILGHIDKSPESPTANGVWAEIAKYNPENFWDKLAKEDAATRRGAVDAYQENLRLVLEEVESVVEDLAGRSVVTSDHGNMLGERLSPIPVRGYGHPSRIHVPPLVDVPWLDIDGESRRETIAEPPVDSEDPDPTVVKDRLASLGYL